MADSQERDYCAEMRKLIDQATSDGPYVPRMVATEIVEKLLATDSQLLTGWLRAQAEHFIYQAITDRDRSRRSAVRHRARGAVFKTATDAAASGDWAALNGFLGMPCTVADGIHKPLATLTHKDLLFVADDYDRQASENKFFGAVHRAIAKKVRTGTVADHFTEEQLAAMFQPLAA